MIKAITHNLNVLGSVTTSARILDYLNSRYGN
jgi:hypothetical protein